MAVPSIIGEVLAGLGSALRTLTDQPRFLIYALLVHAAFLAMFVMSFEWTAKPLTLPPDVNVIEAVVIDESEVQREIDRLREAEARKQTEEEARLRRQREEAQRAEQQRRQAEEQRKQEEQRIAEARRQEEQQRRQAEEQRKREEQRLAEQRRQQEDAARKAEEQRKQAEEARKREEARLAELRRQEEERQRREAEQRRQQEEEQRRLAEEQRRRDEQAAAERARREQSEVERYMITIRQRVERNWNKPPNWTAGLRCTVRVNLIPGGEVIDVRIVRSCGDPVLDSSVERAVYRASPLPVPPADSGLFDRFRELEFVFNPQG